MNSFLTTVEQFANFIKKHPIEAASVREYFSEAELIETFGLSSLTKEQILETKLEVQELEDEEILSEISNRSIPIVEILDSIRCLIANQKMEHEELNATMTFDLVQGFLWTTKDGEQFKPSEMRTDLIFARLNYVLNPKLYKANQIVREAAVAAFIIALRNRALTCKQEEDLTAIKERACEQFNTQLFKNV